ncbi:hypothetical protein NIE88_13135 [Sporolactobacillus shoreicorticis]|uniref:DUF948 domain-containing protein n=1 Tax=Sporolactobacillus shoreicorticis TaxID=1923877 RepID=A0ABW5S540_9BACL|nr:DUF948 domain-containing protein [Sporolactobacillus shoreicorticis]MCO7126710.1 hypothetical protein [Sporolactobacillus shoreicorticis]
MIIVYLSLALAAVSIIAFIVSAVKTVKLMNGSIAKISKTGASLQDQAEGILKEKDELTRNLSRIQSDITQKKGKLKDAVRQAKQSLLSAQIAFYKAKALVHSAQVKVRR